MRRRDAEIESGQTPVGSLLREYFDTLMAEPVPDHLAGLLQELGDGPSPPLSAPGRLRTRRD